MKCHLCKHEIQGQEYSFQGEKICRRCAELVWELTISETALEVVSYHDSR